MNHEEFERLAWQKIDGVIPPEDQRRLDEYLESYPNARAELDELVEFADRLGSLEEQESPPQLRARIDRALAVTTPHWQRPPAKESASDWLKLWRPRFAFMVAGLVLGVVVASVLHTGPRVEPGRVAGAMHLTPTAMPTVFELTEEAGSLGLQRDGKLLTAELLLLEDRSAKLILDAEGEELRLRMASHDTAAKTEIVDDAGRIVLRTEAAGRYVLTAASGELPVSYRVVITSQESVLLDRAVGPEQIGERP
jgi:anti-sigma-K factor RskA